MKVKVHIEKTKTLEIEVLTSGYLYHYTNADALLNILDKKTIWISNNNCLNDYSEMVYTYEMIEKRLEQIDLIKFLGKKICFDNYPDGYESTASCYERICRFERLLKKYVLRKLKQFYKNKQIFIFSLSEEKDSLSLWEGYSKGEGYNIGLNIEKLLVLFKGYHLDHGRVIYDPEKQERIIDGFMNELKNIMAEHLYDYYLNKSMNYEAKYFWIASEIFLYSLLMKKPCFKDEHEYRFCFFIDTNIPSEIKIKYRAARNILIPYIEIPIYDKEKNIFACESITVGPKNNIDIAKFGVKHYIRNEKLKIRVEKSDIPLRY